MTLAGASQYLPVPFISGCHKIQDTNNNTKLLFCRKRKCLKKCIVKWGWGKYISQGNDFFTFSVGSSDQKNSSKTAGRVSIHLIPKCHNLRKVHCIILWQVGKEHENYPYISCAKYPKAKLKANRAFVVWSLPITLILHTSLYKDFFHSFTWVVGLFLV